MDYILNLKYWQKNTKAKYPKALVFFVLRKLYLLLRTSHLMPYFLFILYVKFTYLSIDILKILVNHNLNELTTSLS